MGNEKITVCDIIVGRNSRMHFLHHQPPKRSMLMMVTRTITMMVATVMTEKTVRMMMTMIMTEVDEEED